MKLVEIINCQKQLNVYEALLKDSTIRMSCINGLTMDDVSATNMKISDANLSDLEINGAQMGGAYIHSIGMPPEGHPHYDPNAKQRPLKFEDCNLEGSTIDDCDLSGVAISDCNLTGMTINGILVEDLLAAYKG
ncbi:pentapeptide repeat-containing protein [Mucilaginibacter terrigena]|uniref:Pentapeptide repeat-containing protein n=1 Tax=Mucilaginibacter terrigena TaxID=2492395 RepID=A0A4Q5LSG2_9SPHI|nr:pentapeptide repeat-containing protein [Mucilaginibacter terrigena]RYU92501.1 pentapeptide repeat-containing protein [Mucilaginibacter terrigena]